VSRGLCVEKETDFAPPLASPASRCVDPQESLPGRKTFIQETGPAPSHEYLTFRRIPTAEGSRQTEREGGEVERAVSVVRDLSQPGHGVFDNPQMKGRKRVGAYSRGLRRASRGSQAGSTQDVVVSAENDRALRQMRRGPRSGPPVRGKVSTNMRREAVAP
jgi:hypothetical protein